MDRGLVVHIHYGLVQVLWIHANMQRAVGLMGYVRELTKEVNSIYGIMIPWLIISYSWASIYLPVSVGSINKLCCIGGMLWSIIMLYSPSMSPTVSNKVGKAVLGTLMSVSVTDTDHDTAAGVGDHLGACVVKTL